MLFDKLEAEAKSGELRDCFISMVGDLKQHLKETKTDAGLPKFRDEFILKLPLSVREDNEKFFNRNNTEINKATTFDELFTCLSTYWSYLNHSLLGGIILRYGTEELKDNIKAFSRKVDEFRKVTTIEVFQEIEPSPRVVPPAGFQEFVTKHALSLTSTLEDIECIRHEFCEKFHLHKFAFYLVRVLKGSVLITWLVPHSVARLVEAGMTQELKKALHIEDIMYSDDATPIIEATVASSSPAKASAIEDPTIPAVMVTQSVGVEIATPRYQKTLDCVAIALLVLVSTRFFFLQWLCSWHVFYSLPLVPILGPSIASYISQRWIFVLFLLPFIYLILYFVGICFQVVLDLVFIWFGISSVYFMSAMVCVSALAYLSTHYERLREVDSLPALFKDRATFASCVSVVYLAGICSVIAVLAHTKILERGWISLIYFPSAVIFVAYSLQLILMLFLHTCLSKRRLLAAWLLLTVALLAACYLVVNYLSVHPWIVTSINTFFMILRADFVVMSGDEISYYSHLFEVDFEAAAMVIWMLVAVYASGVALVVRNQKLSILHFFMVWPILFWYAFTFVFYLVHFVYIAAYITDPILSVLMLVFGSLEYSKVKTLKAKNEDSEVKTFDLLLTTGNLTPSEHSEASVEAKDAMTQSHKTSDSLGPEAVYASVECTPEDSEVPTPSTHSDTATAPTEEYVPVVPATPGEGNQAMMVPVGAGGVRGWFAGNKWQGLIVLIALLTYLHLNGILYPFFPVMSLWNPFVTYQATLAPSSPTNLASPSQSPTSITLSWEQPAGDAVDRYDIVYTYQGGCSNYTQLENMVTVNDGTAREYTLQNLQEFSDYNISIVAINATGASIPAVILGTTSKDAPSGCPQSVMMSSVTSSSIIVQWGRVSCIDHNSEITGYTVRYGQTGSTTTVMESVSGTSDSDRMFTASGLIPCTSYTFEVAAVSSERIGPFSSGTTVETLKVIQFQVRLVGQLDCGVWISSNNQQKRDDIAQHILDGVEELCNCGFSRQSISDDAFQCFSADAVTYRGTLHGTEQASSLQLAGFIEHWTTGEQVIPVQGVFLTVDSSCSVIIESLREAECGTATTVTDVSDNTTNPSEKTGSPYNLPSPSDNTAASISRMVVVICVAMAINIALIAGIASIIACFRVKSRTKRIEGPVTLKEFTVQSNIATTPCPAYEPTEIQSYDYEDLTQYSVPEYEQDKPDPPPARVRSGASQEGGGEGGTGGAEYETVATL